EEVDAQEIAGPPARLPRGDGEERDDEEPRQEVDDGKPRRRQPDADVVERVALPERGPVGVERVEREERRRAKVRQDLAWAAARRVVAACEEVVGQPGCEEDVRNRDQEEGEEGVLDG